MDGHDPRLVLDRLIAENHDDYSALSRLLGRNTAYIQQYIKRGIPRRLDERDRRTLAHYFGVNERLLGGPSSLTDPAMGFLAVPVLETCASAGPGTFVQTEHMVSSIAFDQQWLRNLTHRANPNLSIIHVAGDSMEPTLRNGDQAMVDLDSVRETIRDGIYVLRLDGMLNVKRIAVGPDGKAVSIVSDNPFYRAWENMSRESIDLVGRVIWVGRSFD